MARFSDGSPGDERPADESRNLDQAKRAAEEPVEVVNADGMVIDVVSRAEMRAGNLRHRCTYVAVLAAEPPANQPETATSRFEFDSAAELWVHQRAPWKDTCPSYWDVAFGGVCGVGESWRLSAQRELAEEAGVSQVPLTDLGPFSYEDKQTSLIGRCFVAWWPGELSCPDGEVVAVDRVPLDRIGSWLAGRDVCPDSVAAVVPRLRPELL